MRRDFPTLKKKNMRTFRFLDPDHEWKHVGRKHLHPYYLKMPHKHLFCPTRVESFIEYVDLDIYQKIREDFLNGHFCYLANNDEYAYMLLFDLMNGYLRIQGVSENGA